MRDVSARLQERLASLDDEFWRGLRPCKYLAQERWPTELRSLRFTTRTTSGRWLTYVKPLGTRALRAKRERLPFAGWQPYVGAMKRHRLMRSCASYYRSVYVAAAHIQESIQAGKLTIPVLSIAGEASFGPNQKTFVEAFASEIWHIIISNSGHFVAEEQPEALLKALGVFEKEATSFCCWSCRGKTTDKNDH